MSIDYQLEDGLPADIDAERTILGAILLNNEDFFDDSADLNVEDFLLNSHQSIYARMTEILFGMVEGITQVDIVTLANELARNHEIEAVGGVSYLASLTEGLPRRLKIDQYVRIVREKAKLRRMMGVLQNALSRAGNQSEKAESISDFLQDKLVEMAAEGVGHASTLGQIDVEREIKSKRTISSERTALELTWGLPKLDDWTHGAFKGEFTILAGESSGGKTQAALEMMIANAREGTPCAMLSMEMTKEAVKKRCYPLVSDILTADHIRDSRCMNRDTHIPELERVTRELAGLPIYIDDTSPLRIDKLIARMRMMRRKMGIKLFVVDYLQLIRKLPKLSPLEGFEHIVFALRDFPKFEPDCHLVVLSQYSKANGFQKKKQRDKDSLYGGSVIHHAAQNILMITIEDPEKVDPSCLLEVEIRIAKQRDGKRGKVNTFFDRDHLKFCEPQPPLR